MQRRARIAVLCITGVAGCVIPVVVIAKWPALIAEYHTFRLEGARTYEEAEPWLAAIEDDAAHGASSALFARLHGGTSFATFWFFAYVGEEGSKMPLAHSFEKRLRARDELMHVWSHFVRWSEGGDLLARLDAISPSGDPIQPGVMWWTRKIVIPQPSGSPRDQDSFVLPIVVRLEDTLHENLRALAVLWFLGVPIPAPGTDPSSALETWLQGCAPLLRSTVYDEKLGRCKREVAATSSPTREPFTRRNLPVPEAPLPAWEGPAPELQSVMFETLILPGSLLRVLDRIDSQAGNPRTSE
jgi:hypothetical protein